MEQIVRAIRHHYPSEEPTQETRAVSAEDRSRVAAVISGSRFSFPATAQTLAAATKITTIRLGSVCINYFHRADHYLAPKLVRVARRIQCLRRIYGLDKPLTIWFVPTPVSRRLPKNGATVTPEHVNGVMTYINGSDIYVYRLEEFPKVMLHESCHHLPFNNSVWPAEDIRQLETAFGVRDLLPNEAVVETWAGIYQVLFVAHEHPGVGFAASAMSLERDFAAGQAAKLKRHFAGVHWAETTNAYCYYVFRSIFLNHLDEFMTLGSDPKTVTRFLLTHKDDRPREPSRGQSLAMTWFGNM